MPSVVSANLNTNQEKDGIVREKSPFEMTIGLSPTRIPFTVKAGEE